MKQPQPKLAFAVALGAMLSAASLVQAQQITYPQTQRIDHFDEYHGTRVHDPYRWLEEDVRTSKRVADWVEAQNKVTFDYLRSIPQRSKIEQRLTELWNYERYSAPRKIGGGRYVYSKNDGLQNQMVTYVTDANGEQARVLFDPNTWSKDGTISLADTVFSEDGSLVAYGVNDGGSDWKTYKFRNVDTGKDLVDTLRWVKFSGAVWTPDGRGVFYCRYDAPDEGAYVNVNTNQKVYYHRIGTDQSSDVLVYERPDQPQWMFQPGVTEDGRYLMITVSASTDAVNMVMIKDLHESYGMPEALIDNFDAGYSYIANDGPLFYFNTNKNAPRGRIIAIDIRKPDQANWRELVPESQDTLQGVNMLANMFVASYLKDARSEVRVFDLAGDQVRRVQLPGLGTVGGFAGKRTHNETFYTFTSFATPSTTYRYDMITGESTLLRRDAVDMDPSLYETKQVFYTSKDGTRVPMFISHKKGISLDGNNPTQLYGYGGFNISLTPSFSIPTLAWMEMGGVYAQANMRGGGEYGEQWHKAGTKLQKQNVFDDFIAAAEWLIDNNYTKPSKLAVRGGSNGGLLIGACMTQRPDLFGVCLPAVGVMDMLRFHKFTIGWAWVSDYGSSDDPDQFKALHAYSPVHNLEPGTEYPATLVTTADTDDRVVPGHSFKFAAGLQYAQSGDAPVLIRIESRAGHGGGTPTSKRIEQAADMFAFVVKNLKMDF